MISKFKKMVSRFWDTKDSVAYKVGCSCGSDDCGATIEIEYDPELQDMLLMHFYTEIHIGWYNMGDLYNEGILNWFRFQVAKIKTAIKVLFTGRLEMSGEFILQGEEHIKDFIEALNEGVDYCKFTRKHPSTDAVIKEWD